MKEILMSIKPEYVEKIFKGEKTIEVRKVALKIKEPFKVYIYCTKGKPLFRSNGDYDEGHFEEYVCDKNYFNYYLDYEEVSKKDFLNGKVVGEFICDKVDEYKRTPDIDGYFKVKNEELNKMQLNYIQFAQYGTRKNLYGLHISQLKIYDKPKELSEFRNICESCHTGKKCKVEYSALLRNYLTIQDEVKCCEINTDYKYAKYDPFYTYDWFIEEINSNPTLIEKDNREAIEVVFFSDDYREIIYSYCTSIKWAKGIYSDKFCRDHKIKFRFRILREDEK